MLDIRTLFFICGIVSISLTLPMINVSLRHKYYPGFHIWTVGFILNGIGMILLSSRGLLPDALTVVVANSLLITHLSMIGAGLLRFTGKPCRPLLESLPTLITVVLLSYFSWYRPDVDLRIVIVSTMAGVLYLRIGIYGARDLFRHFGYRNWLIILTCLAMTLWSGVRTAFTLLDKGQIIDFMSAGMVHGLNILFYSVATILIMTDLVIINGQQFEKELRAEKERYRLLFSQSPVGVVQLDRTGRIVEINKTFARILGAPEERLIGLDTIANIENPEMAAAIRTALKGGTGHFEGAYVSILGGRSSFLQVLTQGIHAKDSSVTGAMGIFQDVTARKEVEAALRNQERLQGALELAGAVCHEMNQPLMVIQGCSELIAMEVSSAPRRFGEQLSAKLETISQQVDRMKAITQKLMGITRYETKKYRNGKIFDIAKGVGSGG